ncbi:unnamed protein product [Adineta ricciae]|uniref:Uncharacterized protein n=1 Tax=Adineta ricciae TaxID=249248 RepID=A0A813QTH1_ADIRI|nr:unnamed protein product [Adineta ricciae]
MKTYLILFLLFELVTSVPYNQICTFSSGSCNWSVGRRWHIMTLDSQNKVLIADIGSKEDDRTGFTDTIISPWLQLSPLCSFDGRLTFRFSISNDRDHIEIYLIENNRTQTTSLGQWKSTTNKAHSIKVDDLSLQQGNITFQVSEQFQIAIEVRHVTNDRNHSNAWFALDDILIENCPFAIVNTTLDNFEYMSTTIPVSIWLSKLNVNESNSTLANASFWKLTDFSSEPSSLSSRQTLLTLIIYLFCALIAFTLLIILCSIILFTYRKHCCPTSRSAVDHRYRYGTKSFNNRIGIQIENLDRDYQTVKTIDSTVRPCFE